MPKSILVRCFICLIVLICSSTGWSQTAADTSRVGPQTYALIIGISSYKFIRPLNYADKDAELFRDFMKSPGGGNLKEENVFCLLNDEAKSANFWVKGMAWLKSKKLSKGDRLFIYLAGHGDAIDEDEFFFLTYDCNPAGDKNNYIVTGNIQLYNLKSRISSYTENGVDVFFIMDACRTNELPGGKEGQQALNAAISEKRAGEIIMLATGAGQESLEDPSIGSGHGLFTYYLIDGLAGMADSTRDNKVTLNELQRYVDNYVPTVAMEKFKRKQIPFFCCNKDYDKTVTTVDTSFLRNWLKIKQLRGKGSGNSYKPQLRSRNVNKSYAPIDTTLNQVFTLFNAAIKESRLTGDASAEFYYNLLEKKFPGHTFTIDAQSTLTVEFINFAQSKINLYLECKDASSIQKIRAQIDDESKSDEINASLNRMEKVARQEFYDVGQMLEKAIGFINSDDSVYAKLLEGKMYFFKAMGYYGKERRFMDINKALEYAYTAYANEKNAAYILNTLASLHLDNNRMDSAIFYATKAIASAPQWRFPYVNLAYAYKSLNRIDSALKYYRKAILVDPSSADAYVDLGHYYYSLSNADSAITNYQKALRIEPNNIYASNNIGWLYHDRAKYDSAIVYFKKSIGTDSKFFNAYNGLGRSFFGMKKYDSARIYYEKAFANYKDKSIVNIYIGNFFRDLKQYDSAQAYYRLAIQYDPNYEETYNNLGRVFKELKEYDSAKTYFLKAIQVNPFSAFSLINIGLVYREQNQTDSTYAYLQKAALLEPRNPSVLNYLGTIYGQDKKSDLAKSYFKRALEIKPDFKSAYNNLVKIYKDLQELDSITAYLKKSGQYNVNNVSLLNDLGKVFLDQKRYDSATLYFRRAIKMDPLNAQLYNNLGLVFRGMKLFDSARILFYHAAQLDPQNGATSLNLAQLYRQLRQIDSATYYYKKQLLQRVENNAQAYLTVGLFLYDMNAFDSSIVYFKKAIELDRSLLAAYNNIGSAYMLLEKNDSAFAYYRTAIKLDSTYPNAALNLGLLYHSTYQYDSAIIYLLKSIILNPTSGKIYYHLASSYAMKNQVNLAVQSLKLAFEKGFKNYDVLISDPDFDGLRNNEEFKALIKKYLPGK